MGRGGTIVLWFVAALASLLFMALIVAPWLAFLGIVTIPGLHFDAARAALSAADVAILTVAGATGLLALVTISVSIHARRAVLAIQREAKIAEDTLTSSQEQIRVGLQLVTVGQEQVEAGKRQAAVSQRVLEASFRPLMADVPRGFRSYPDTGRPVEVVPGRREHIDDESEVISAADYGKPGYYSVALRNIGTGAAIVTGVKLEGEGVALNECNISAAIVPPGELSRFTFTIPADRDDLMPIRNAILRSTALLVVVRYTDQAGLHEIRTEAHLSRYRQTGGVSPWYIRQVTTFDWDGEKPTITSAPADPHGIPR
jgi:hypothetical protein